MKTIHILATAHGTDSAEGRAVINLVRVELDDMLRAHGGSEHTQYQVHEAYVDVQSPNVDEAALALPKEELCVIVPILLSTGFHTQVDLRRAAKNSGIAQVRIAEPLGLDVSLAALQRARLEQAGWSPGAGMVVQGSAGSSRQDAAIGAQVSVRPYPSTTRIPTAWKKWPRVSDNGPPPETAYFSCPPIAARSFAYTSLS